MIFSNAAEVELLVNGASAGRRPMPAFGRVTYNLSSFAPGTLRALGYTHAGDAAPAAAAEARTAGPPAALRVSVKDGFGARLVAGCRDVALVQVEVVDAAGVAVPDARAVTTFAGEGPAALLGTGSGDAVDHAPAASATRATYHGLALAVVQGSDTPGLVTVRASAPGLAGGAVDIPVAARDAGWAASWCHIEQRL